MICKIHSAKTSCPALPKTTLAGYKTGYSDIIKPRLFIYNKCLYLPFGSSQRTRLRASARQAELEASSRAQAGL